MIIILLSLFVLYYIVIIITFIIIIANIFIKNTVKHSPWSEQWNVYVTVMLLFYYLVSGGTYLDLLQEQSQGFF